jgi:hypothetical protein
LFDQFAVLSLVRSHGGSKSDDRESYTALDTIVAALVVATSRTV